MPKGGRRVLQCKHRAHQRHASHADFDFLADQLTGIEGFILWVNDMLGARATFVRFHVSAAETTYTIGVGEAQRVDELIVSNFAVG